MSRQDPRYTKPRVPVKPLSPTGVKQPATFSSSGKVVGSNRDWIPFIIFCALALILVGRLAYLQVFAAEDYRNAALAQRTKEIPMPAKRGAIYDRNGMVLAMSVDAETIYAKQDEIADKETAAKILTETLGGEYDEYYELLTSPQTYIDEETGREQRTDFVYLRMKVDEEVANKLRGRSAEIKALLSEAVLAENSDARGIYFLEDTKRVYPYGSIGMQVIGAVTPEGKGAYGLELMYDSVLSGTDGVLLTEYSEWVEDRPLSGRPIPGSDRTEVAPIDGQNIVVAIDIELQQYVESELARMGVERETEKGNVLFLDGATGEIYATASLPLPDRANLTTEAVEKGATTLQSICYSYEPGSIFKAVTAAAALEEKVMKTGDELFVPAVRYVDDKPLSDSHPRSDMTMSFRYIIAESSNVGVSLIKDKISDETYAAYLEKWGFGQTPLSKLEPTDDRYGIGQSTRVDFPGESRGSLMPWEDWSARKAVDVSYGQGIQVSSLQMASFYGTVANDGIKYQPHFLIDRPQAYERPEYKGELVMSSATVYDLTSMLTSVVSEGTGHASRIEGYTVAGKTGTAQKADTVNGGYLPDNYIVSFVGFLPNAESKFVCITSMDNPIGAEGSAPTGPLFASIMKFATTRYMIEPDI
jgi:cell division protein FtsI (penicillin-binding protein 3)